MFHDNSHHSDPSAGACPFLSRPADDVSVSQWEEFYKHAAACPWIQEYGMSSLAKSPVAWQAALEKCPVIQEMSAEKSAHYELKASSAKKIFDFLFPSTPAINSLLATAYISGPPNFFLALVPPNINPSSLNTLVAFAVGGLLGDVFLHLLPQVFMGEGNDGKVRSHLVLQLSIGTLCLIGRKSKYYSGTSDFCWICRIPDY
jgi:ZIP Zinc transporter